MHHGDPLVIASATPPMMMNDAVAAIFGRTAPSTLPNRKPDTIRRGDHYRSGAVARRRGLTGAASAARSVAQSPSDGSEPGAYSLVRRERKRVSQARGGQAFAGDRPNMVARSGNSQQFLKGFPLGLVMQRINLYVFSIELRPNDLASPRTSRRTDEFIQTRT